MTGEPVPASDSPGRAAAPRLRASHADRDRVVEVLRVAAGDGRLTADELDERLEAALSARTHGELAALTEDLPARPARRPRTWSGSPSASGTPRAPAAGWCRGGWRSSSPRAT